MQQQIATIIESTKSKTSTNPRNYWNCYDMMSNLTTSHEDTITIMNRGLTIGEDRTGGLGVRGK